MVCRKEVVIVLRGTDLKVGQRICLYLRDNNDRKIEEIIGTIIPRQRPGSPLFEADKETYGLHNGDCDFWCEKYWFMHSSLCEGQDFSTLTDETIGISELI